MAILLCGSTPQEPQPCLSGYSSFPDGWGFVVQGSTLPGVVHKRYLLFSAHWDALSSLRLTAFSRAKLGTAYRNWPRHTGGATSRAQHRGAALVCQMIEARAVIPQNLALGFHS